MNIHALKKDEEKKARELIMTILNSEFTVDQDAYPPADLEHITKSYNDKNETFYVARDHNKITGTVGIKKDTDSDALLRRLFVDPVSRGTGLGSKLVDKACEFCKKHGYRKITFRSTSNMIGAINLCKKKGFVESERMNLGGLEIVKLDKII